MDRADQFDLGYVEDVTTLSAVMNTVSSVTLPRVEPVEVERARPAVTQRSGSSDEVIEVMKSLRSGDAQEVLSTLATLQRLDPVLAPQLIRLMAWNEVTVPVRQFLAKHAVQQVGMLVDFLLDESQDFAIRRRIPRVLAAISSQRALDGLLQGLEDRRFEVRFQCGRALDFLIRQAPQLRLDPERVFSAVDREVSVNRTIWDGRRLLDKRDSADEFSFLDEVLRERAHQSLEHVFSLLSIVLPREPLRVAFRALHSGDDTMRALALEYVEGVVPASIREKLFAVIDAGQVAVSAEAREAALQELLASNESLAVEWRRRLTAPAPSLPDGGSASGSVEPGANK
jgi:hypothetical protein